MISRRKGIAVQEQTRSAWNHFVAQQVLPAFQEIKSMNEKVDGTTFGIQQAPSSERWVRLTWMVAPSASVLALLPPSMRTAEPPKTVLIYTIIGDECSSETNAWCETRIPDEAAGLAPSSRVFREALGDYRHDDITKDTITNSFLANYQRHVLGSEPNW
jgi:hypothetical protein